jgi:ubiquinone/menaquinone biosynthesis C-methylase UbiE
VAEQRPPQKRQSRPHDLAWQSETVVANYDQRRFTSITGRAFDRLEKRAIGKLLVRIETASPVRTILDLPCGTGRISEFLLERGHVVTCGDFSDAMLAASQKRFSVYPSDRVQYRKLDVYDIQYPAGTFDCVTCIRLFQHLTSDERARALRELGRVSKRYVIASVMYTSGYYAIVRKLRKALGAYAPRYTASQAEIDREAAHAGLRVVSHVFPQPAYGGGLVVLFQKSEADAGSARC